MYRYMREIASRIQAKLSFGIMLPVNGVGSQRPVLSPCLGLG